MAYEIEFSEDSKQDLKLLRVVERRTVLDAIELHLRHEPTKESKSRIKRLKEMKKPQYRLRVDNFRVFYDVNQKIIEVIAVVDKPQAAEWLEREGVRAE